MKNEIIEVVDYKEQNDIMVSDHSIKQLGERIEKMKAFVSNQMVKGIDNDYAVIPGTKKISLLKPGAEKILLLFNLGFKFNIINQVIDHYAGEVSFLIDCKVFRKSDGKVVGEYMGYCSNKEKKYLSSTPSDIVNTVLKMCQKRALVGAAIAATGASDYFTQDMEDSQLKKPIDSSKFTANKDTDLGEYVVKGGKFNGKKLSEIDKRELSGYINYITDKSKEEGKEINGELKVMIDNARDFLR
jgi:hypothetical protein